MLEQNHKTTPILRLIIVASGLAIAGGLLLGSGVTRTCGTRLNAFYTDFCLGRMYGKAEATAFGRLFYRGSLEFILGCRENLNEIVGRGGIHERVTIGRIF